MNSIDIWKERWLKFNKSSYSSGSSVPATIAEIFHDYEKYLVNKNMKFSQTMKVLDVGAGSGRWTSTFAPKVAKVVAIEPTDAYYILKKNTACFSNVKCLKKSFEEYKSNEQFDIVIISGVLMYIQDEVECGTFLSDALRKVAPGGSIILREPIGRSGRCKCYKNIKSSKNTQTKSYIEVTRTKEYYDKICSSVDFKLVKSIPVHATVFFNCNFPLLKNTIQKLMLKLFNKRHLTFWYLYNACFSRFEALLRMAFDIPKLYLMIYKNNSHELLRSKAFCSMHTLKHIENEKAE